MRLNQRAGASTVAYSDVPGMRISSHAIPQKESGTDRTSNTRSACSEVVDCSVS